MKIITKDVQIQFQPFQIILQFDTDKEVTEFRQELSIIGPKNSIPKIGAIAKVIDKRIY